MKASERLESFAAPGILRSRVAWVRVAWIMCGLATHVPAGEPVPFIYQNPYLLVTKGSATVIDAVGNRKTVETTTVDDAKTAAVMTLPGVLILSGGDTVETSSPKISDLKNGDLKTPEACLFSPTAGSVRASLNTVFHLPSGTVSPKTVVDKEKAGPRASLEMLKGDLFLTIDGEGLRKANQSSEFTLRVPKNILAVKGTQFSVVHQEKTNFTDVMMREGAVELRLLDGRTIGYLEKKNRMNTIYRLDADGGVLYTKSLPGVGESSSDARKNPKEAGTTWMSSHFFGNISFVEAESIRREVTVTAMEQGSDRPRKQLDYVMLKTNDKERTVAISYRRPDKGPQPEELIVRIQMPYQRQRHFVAYQSVSRYGLLFQIKSSAKLQAKVDGMFMMRDRNYKMDITGRVGVNKPGCDLNLGETFDWQAVFVPLSDSFPAGTNEKTDDEPCLKIALKIPPELAEFKIEFSPIFISEGARSIDRN